MWWGRRPAGPALSPPPDPRRHPASSGRPLARGRAGGGCGLGSGPAGLRAATTRLAHHRSAHVFRLILARSWPMPSPKPWAAPMTALRAATRGRWPGHRHAPRRRACCGAASPTRTSPTGGRAWSVPRGARTAPTRPPARNNGRVRRAGPVRVRVSAARWRPGRVLLASASWLLWPLITPAPKTRIGAIFSGFQLAPGLARL